MRLIINNLLKKFGYQISKTTTFEAGVVSSSFSMYNALGRLKERNIEINTVIDIGASNGRWSEKCMNFYPNANYLLIEAQEPHENELKIFTEKNENVEYILAAAGNIEGKIYFDNSDLLGGVAMNNPSAQNCIEVPVITIDKALTKHKMEGPYLIKLDTHGFEVPILEGAKETLKRTNIVVIEAYNYQLTDDSLQFYELCDYMNKLGFSVIEIVDLMRRKYDDTFWQMDIFFISSDFNFRKYNKYK